MRDAVHSTAPCPVGAVVSASAIAAVSAAVARREASATPDAGPTRRLFVVPTTADTLAHARLWSSSPRVAIVGTAVDDAHSPASLLAVLNSDAAQRPHTIILFTDQLVDVVNAPVAVMHQGQVVYASALEAVLHIAHGYRAQVWTGAGFEALGEAREMADVMGLLMRYYAACDRLGAAWAARHLQAQRLPAQRAQQARRQLRMGLSALMYACRTSTLSADLRSTTQQILGLQQQWATAQRQHEARLEPRHAP
jgi:hypothetical protein